MDDADLIASLRAENDALRLQIATLTEERDSMASLVFGKLHGQSRAPNGVPTPGGAPSDRTDCTMCGNDCHGGASMVYGSPYCSACIVSNGNAAIMDHARDVMKAGGVQRATKAKPLSAYAIDDAKLNPDTLDTQVVSRTEWDRWLDSLQTGQKP